VNVRPSGMACVAKKFLAIDIIARFVIFCWLFIVVPFILAGPIAYTLNIRHTEHICKENTP
jgi:hypothetical protein